VRFNSVPVVAALGGCSFCLFVFVYVFVVGCVGYVLPEGKTFLLLNSAFEQQIRVFVAK